MTRRKAAPVLAMLPMLVCLGIVAWYSWQNPHLTQMQIFRQMWEWYVAGGLLSLLALFILAWREWID